MSDRQSTTGPPRYFTPGVWVLVGFAALGIGSLLYRLIWGLGAVTNLDQQYPWGLWIAIDVAAGVALAAGGFTTAFLAHVVHREEYEPVVRPALLTAMIGYTFAGLGVATDLGRYYNIWHMMVPAMWQGNSVLFEVGMCVLLYVSVLYIEFLPIVGERFIGRVRLPGLLGTLNRPVDRLLRFLDQNVRRFMTVFLLAGVVLSCMHQSSLGTLMVIAPTKLHPLWHTPVLPLLFLLSALSVGYPMVIFESTLAARSLRIPPERRLLARLGRYVPVLLGIYFAAKMIDLVNRGVLGYLAEVSTASLSFWIEVSLGVVVPFFIFLSHRLRRTPGWLFAGSSLVVFGVILNRLNVFVIGYSPPYAEARYVPAWTEWALTLGYISIIVLLYRFFVFHFPVISHFRRARS